MLNRVLIFAGTYEGHALADFIKSEGLEGNADFCVATEYGSEMIENIEGISILEGRLTEEDIEELIEEKSYSLIIDATHPYAAVVTKNIKAACENKGVSYLRLLREEGIFQEENVIKAENVEDAVSKLSEMEGRIFLTTGSKELHKFSKIRGFEDRVVARVLPSIESLELCKNAGLAPKNTIAMQGPFTLEMNLATLNQYKCDIMVTKNTGKPGGFDDKIQCAKQGFKLVVIDRPIDEKGLSLEEVKCKVKEHFGI